MRYARRSGVWHSQTLEKKHVYRVFHHAAVTQHRRELISSTQHLPLSPVRFRPATSTQYTAAYPCPKKPSRVKQERERWTQRLRSLTGLRIPDIS